jgi:hypothetical protein
MCKIIVGIFRDGPFLPPREGASYSIVNLAEALAKKNIKIILFRCYRGWDDPELYRLLNFKTIFLSPDEYYNDTKLLKKIIFDERVNILQFDSSDAVTTLGKKLKKETGKKIVFDVHNVHSQLAKEMGKGKKEIKSIIKIEEEAVRISDMILCRSELDKSILRKRGAKESKLRVYVGSIPVSKFKFSQKKKKGNLLVFVGNNFYGPNEQAIRILGTQIMPKLKNCSLMIVGPTPKELMKEVEAKNIRFLGEVDDLNSVFSKCKIGLCPVTSGSGTRTKILDYMAAGLLVITTSKGIEGLNEKIKKFVILEDSVEYFSDKIVAACNDKEFLKKTIKARNFVEKNYSIEKNLGPWISAFKTAQLIKK